MFPYVHICFAKDILGHVNDETVLGAVFPDTVIAGHLDHSATHRQCGALYSYLKTLGVFTDFAEGVITHGTAPAGIDYFCDERYQKFQKGYAFAESGPLVSKVIESCRLPAEMGEWKAHNFIEMAADLWLFENRTDCHGYLAKALSNQDLILSLSQVLSPFFDVPVSRLAMSFPVYGEFVLMDDVTPLSLAKKYSQQTAKKHGINIDIQGAAEVIEEAVEIVDKTLPAFLATCADEIGDLITTLRSK